MGFTFLKKLPTPAEIRNQYPIAAAIQELKAKRDQEIRHVFTGSKDISDLPTYLRKISSNFSTDSLSFPTCGTHSQLAVQVSRPSGSIHSLPAVRQPVRLSAR